MNKARGDDGIPAELFQILPDYAVQALHSNSTHLYAALIESEQHFNNWHLESMALTTLICLTLLGPVTSILQTQFPVYSVLSHPLGPHPRPARLGGSHRCAL